MQMSIGFLLAEASMLSSLVLAHSGFHGGFGDTCEKIWYHHLDHTLRATCRGKDNPNKIESRLDLDGCLGVDAAGSVILQKHGMFSKSCEKEQARAACTFSNMVLSCTCDREPVASGPPHMGTFNLGGVITNVEGKMRCFDDVYSVNP